ncbi:MAG: magnesium transporter [Zestosphaera sp.]
MGVCEFYKTYAPLVLVWTLLSVELSEILERVEELVEGGDIAALKNFLSGLDPHVIKDVLERLEPSLRSKIIPHIPLLSMSSVISKFSEDLLHEIASLKGIDELIELIGRIPIDEAVDLIQKLPPKVAAKTLNALPVQKAREISELLKYPPESVGGIMTTRIPIFRAVAVVDEVVREYIARESAGAYDKHSYLYAVDEGGKLVGWIEVKALLTKPRSKLLRDVVSKPPATVNAISDREVAAKLAVTYDVVELPVVNGEGKLLGIVTLDDVLDVAIAEFSEDLVKFGGFTDVIKGSYMSADIKSILTRRVPPILLRSLALGEVKPKDVLKILRKEVLTSLAMASILLPVAFAIAFTITWFFYSGELLHAIYVGLVVGTALLVSMLLADVIGALLPVALAKYRVDPAGVSAPLITTIGDIVTSVTYFTIAMYILVST